MIDLREMMDITRDHIGKNRSLLIVLDKTVSEKMIGILVDDVSSVTTYNKEDIDQDAQSSSESHRDILGVIRKHRKDGGGKDKSTLVIWLDIKIKTGRKYYPRLPVALPGISVNSMSGNMSFIRDVGE